MFYRVMNSQEGVEVSINDNFDYRDYDTFLEVINMIKSGKYNNKKFVLNLEECSFIDSVAMGMLVVAHDEADVKNVNISMLTTRDSDVEKRLLASYFHYLYDINGISVAQQSLLVKARVKQMIDKEIDKLAKEEIANWTSTRKKLTNAKTTKRKKSVKVKAKQPAKAKAKKPVKAKAKQPSKAKLAKKVVKVKQPVKKKAKAPIKKAKKVAKVGAKQLNKAKQKKTVKAKRPVKVIVKRKGKRK